MILFHPPSPSHLLSHLWPPPPLVVPNTTSLSHGLVTTPFSGQSPEKRLPQGYRIDESSSSTKKDGRRKLEDSPDDGMMIDACDVASESSSSVVFSDSICRVTQQYETPVNPTGCMVKIVIRSTHGDEHYVGLNGIALYDSFGTKIAISPDQLQALPCRYTPLSTFLLLVFVRRTPNFPYICTDYRDINDLVDVRRAGPDARCLQNLVNPSSPNDTFSDRFMWLAPLSVSSQDANIRGNATLAGADRGTASNLNTPNTIFILMDEQESIGCIRIWNYSKTPSRGVKELEVGRCILSYFRHVLLTD